MSQNYSNHRQFVKGYHGFALPLIVALLGGSIANLATTSPDNLYSASLMLLVSILIVLIMFYARRFALIAQDRAIRAEENLRHFILTGKKLDPALKLSQIIALRFASDEEMSELVKKAIEENLSSREIKKLVKNWRADFHRV